MNQWCRDVAVLRLHQSADKTKFLFYICLFTIVSINREIQGDVALLRLYIINFLLLKSLNN